jgi:DNA (cytosine-5)-methyltransferase 1
MAGGLGGGNCSQYWLEDDGMQMPIEKNNKPEYRVLSMDEIRALPWNGFNAVSTFSGCGGSSTGYRMAGFRVLWASEFIDAARDSYRANKADYTILDGRDIRQVTASEILSAIKMQPGELDLFDGSPPCASFSTAGKREAGWGKVKKYSDKSQRTDDLFFEYARLIKGIQPKTFVAENVSGLVKGTAKGYFLEILAALKACGYKVSCRVLDAQWLGVPQSRQRTIFVGVREDLGVDPAHPKPLPYRYSVRDALPWIVAVGDNGGFGKGAMRSAESAASATIGASPQTGNGKFPPSLVEAVIYDIGGSFASAQPITNAPCPTVCCETSQSHYLVRGKGDKDTFTAHAPDGVERRKFTIAELKRICGFPDDFILTGTYAQQWERLGRAVPPVMMSHIAATVRDEMLRMLK